jgi:hypothetical protein
LCTTKIDVYAELPPNSTKTAWAKSTAPSAAVKKISILFPGGSFRTLKIAQRLHSKRIFFYWRSKLSIENHTASRPMRGAACGCNGGRVW